MLRRSLNCKNFNNYSLIGSLYRKPSLNLNALEQEFTQHQKYSDTLRRIQKRKIMPKHGGKVGQLPPLDDEIDPNILKDGIDFTSRSIDLPRNSLQIQL